jgi:cell division protein ZapE
MNLLSIYETRIRELNYSGDAAQSGAMTTLNRVAGQLVAAPAPGSLKARLKRRYLGPLANSWSTTEPLPGAYLWGGVGRGKTFMMDLFFDSLPFDDKLRFHFHRLMYRVHNHLAQLKHRRDPLEIVAEDLACRARVICFDEFFVSDIADAMLLGKLMSGLFKRGVSLVATSNIPPDKLYSDGLQREQFLPAIDLIKRHTEIVHVGGDTDYRLRVLEQAEIYHAPLDAAATNNLDTYFRCIAHDAGTSGQEIEILGRSINTRKRADGIAWFDFAALCAGPRSQDDYIEIARCFQTVILSDVPLLDHEKENEARRFIALVDEFYDRKVKLIVSAATGIDNLYAGVRLTGEFERTRSRLREMQSDDYLAAPHVP